MGEMFNLIQGFALVKFLLLMYFLTKQILEKNINSISMMKVLVYQNEEIGRDAFLNYNNITKVTFLGSKEEWAKVDIEEGNKSLTKVNVEFKR